MVNKLFSIFIPTYNRAHLIGETLEAFIYQVSKYKIPIIISDNCSDDNTFEIVSYYMGKYPEIRYFKNDENKGFDGNVINLTSFVDTKYCWLFGDDDVINNGAIDTIVNLLKTDIDLIVVNASLSSFDLSQTISNQHLNIFNDRLYNRDENHLAFTDLVSYTSFIGSLIIKKEKWALVDYNKYLKTGFVHVGIVFEYLSFGCNVYYISNPLVKIRLGNSGWSRNSFEIWHILWVRAINSIPNYPNELKEKVYLSHIDLGIRSMLIQRATGAYTKSEFVRFIKNDSNFSLVVKLLFFLILFIPIKPLKYFYIKYLVFKKPANLNYLLFELSNSNHNIVSYI